MNKVLMKKWGKILAPTLLSTIFYGLYLFADTYVVALDVGTYGLSAFAIVLPVTYIGIGFGSIFGAGLAGRISREIAKGPHGSPTRELNSFFPLALVYTALAMVTMLVAKNIIFWIGTGFQDYPSMIFGSLEAPTQAQFEANTIQGNWWTLIPVEYDINAGEFDLNATIDTDGDGVLDATYVLNSFGNANRYFWPMWIFAFFCITTNGFNAVARATGKASATLWFNGMGSILNVILDWFLVIHHGFGIEWGIRGAAFATALSWTLTTFAYIILFSRPSSNYRLVRGFAQWHFLKIVFPKTMSTGLTSGVFAMIPGLTFLIFDVMLGIGYVQDSFTGTDNAVNMIQILKYDGKVDEYGLVLIPEDLTGDGVINIDDVNQSITDQYVNLSSFDEAGAIAHLQNTYGLSATDAQNQVDLYGPTYDTTYVFIDGYTVDEFTTVYQAGFFAAYDIIELILFFPAGIAFSLQPVMIEEYEKGNANNVNFLKRMGSTVSGITGAIGMVVVILTQNWFIEHWLNESDVPANQAAIVHGETVFIMFGSVFIFSSMTFAYQINLVAVNEEAKANILTIGKVLALPVLGIFLYEVFNMTEMFEQYSVQQGIGNTEDGSATYTGWINRDVYGFYVGYMIVEIVFFIASLALCEKEISENTRLVKLLKYEKLLGLTQHHVSLIKLEEDKAKAQAEQDAKDDADLHNEDDDAPDILTYTGKKAKGKNVITSNQMAYVSTVGKKHHRDHRKHKIDK